MPIMQLIVDGLSAGLVFVLLATGLVLITSVNKMLFMAYGMFYTIGAYTTWFVINNFELPYFVSLLIGILCSGLLGVLCYLLVFQRLLKLEGGFLATLIASMGLLLVLSQGNLLVFGTQTKSIPSAFSGTLSLPGVNISISKLFLILIGIAVTLALFWLYEKTAVGRSMRAVAYHPDAAAVQGVNCSGIYLLVLGLGTALAGIAGGVIAPVYGMNPQMGNNVIWTIMLMTMLGGMDSLLGAVLGGLVIGQILSFGQFLIGGTIQIILFVIIGIILYFRPKGLLGRGIDIGI